MGEVIHVPLSTSRTPQIQCEPPVLRRLHDHRGLTYRCIIPSQNRSGEIRSLIFKTHFSCTVLRALFQLFISQDIQGIRTKRLGEGFCADRNMHNLSLVQEEISLTGGIAKHSSTMMRISSAGPSTPGVTFALTTSLSH